MTYEKLRKIIQYYKIPEEVILESDSGWECSETPMDGVYWNPSLNTIIFVQSFSKYEIYDPNNSKGVGWIRCELPEDKEVKE